MIYWYMYVSPVPKWYHHHPLSFNSTARNQHLGNNFVLWHTTLILNVQDYFTYDPRGASTILASSTGSVWFSIEHLFYLCFLLHQAWSWLSQFFIHNISARLPPTPLTSKSWCQNVFGKITKPSLDTQIYSRHHFLSIWDMSFPTSTYVEWFSVGSSILCCIIMPNVLLLWSVMVGNSYITFDEILWGMTRFHEGSHHLLLPLICVFWHILSWLGS